MSVTYRLALAQRGTSGLGTVIISDVLGTIGVPKTAQPLRFTEVLDSWGVLEFSLPIDHASVTRANFALANREMHLYRDDGGGEELVWGGKLWHHQVEGWEVRFRALGWYFDLTRREVEDDYASTAAAPKDQFDIVRELVTATQGETDGNLGITFWSTADSGVTRRMIICAEERRKISDVIQDLAAADDGFDFTVHPDKTLELYSPRRGITTPTVTLDTAINVSDFNYEEDATELNTQMAGVGEQEDCDVPNVYVTTDVGQRTIYGLLQDHVNPEETRDEDWLAAATDEALRISRVTRLQPSVVLPTDLQLDAGVDAVAYGDVEVGDEVLLEASRGAVGGFGEFSQQVRVISRTVEVARSGVEKIIFGLDQVVV